MTNFINRHKPTSKHHLSLHDQYLTFTINRKHKIKHVIELIKPEHNKEANTELIRSNAPNLVR